MSWGQIEALNAGLAELKPLEDEAAPDSKRPFEELSQDVAYQNRTAQALKDCAGPDGKLDMAKLLRVTGKGR